MARDWLSVLPGVRAARRQVEDFASLWQAHNERELEEIGGDDELYVALGDSLSQGIGASTMDSAWPISLTNRMAANGRRVRLVNLSKSGGKIEDVVDEQLPRLHELDRVPSVVTCTVGSNDLIGSVRFRSTVAQMSALLQVVPDHTVVATLPDRGSLVARAFNKRLRLAAAESSITLADVAPRAFRGRGMFAPDLFHPSDAGYEAWLDAFAEALGVSLGTPGAPAAD